MLFRGVRGAITIKENTEEEILQATDRLIRTMIKENELNQNLLHLFSFLLQMILQKHFPARAMRSIDGWNLCTCHVYERNFRS